MASDLNELLGQTQLRVIDGNFVLVGCSLDDGAGLIRALDLVAGTNQPLMVFRDPAEVSILIEESVWAGLEFSAPSLKVESGFRIVTLDQTLSWDVVGYLARVTAILAAEAISVGVLSSFSRDHLLINQNQLDAALGVLNQEIGKSANAL